MADVVSPAVIKKTQDILGKYVKKPQLSEKLLKKPPFRFLHDVINAVIQETGFLDGLYTADELNSDNVKEKNAKIEYLQKLIDTVKIVTKENLKVKPSKIVAGHEPEKTNELLQAIGKALDKKLSSSDAVEKVRNVDTPSTTAKNNVAQSTKIQRTKPTKSDAPPTTKPTSKLQSTTAPGKSTISNKSQLTKKNTSDKSSSVKEKGEKTKIEQNGVRSKTKSHSRGSSKGTAKESSELISLKPRDSSDKNAGIIETNSSVDAQQENPVISEILPAEKPLSPGLSKDPLGEEILIDRNDNQTELTTNNHSMESPNKTNNKTNSTTTKTTLNAVDDEPTQQKIPTSFSAELVDIIDQEAELRRKEKLEKKSTRHKTRRKLSNDDDNNTKLKTNDQDPAVEDEDLHSSAKNNNNGNDSATVNEINNITRNKSFIKDKDEKGTLSRPRTSLRPPSVRPASARPGAPRRRDKNIEVILRPEETIKMAGIDIKVNSSNAELDDDGENLIIIEDPTVNQDEMINFGNQKIGSNTQMSVDGNIDGVTAQPGHLVQQILETQKELSKIELGGETNKKTEMDWDAATLRQRQSSAKQMDALRDSIQKLTRSVNPLGKLMDFLQEDIDSMQLEMTMWRNVYSTATADFKREQGLTQTAIEPLKHQLSQIEANIKEQIELTNTSRVNILQNEEKIFKLLNEV